MVREARDILREDHECLILSLDIIQGVPDSELSDEYDEYLEQLVNDTLQWCGLEVYNELV